MVENENYNMPNRKMPFITICMPTYNSMWSLKQVLQSILRLEYPKNLLRLVFVDSFSNDGTYEYLMEFKKKYENLYEKIIIVRTSRRGVGFARNICLKYVKGWVFWADSDVILAPETLKILLAHFERDPKVGWARAAYKRLSSGLQEIVARSFTPKTFRTVDYCEATSSLIKPEAMKVFGKFYDDGGKPFKSPWEAAEQYVRLRKAGWKIISDGRLMEKSIHLTKKSLELGNSTRLETLGNSCKLSITMNIKVIRKYFNYYFNVFPERPLHLMIRAGDLKLLLKIIYWLLYVPFSIILTFIFKCPLLTLIYMTLPFVYYLYAGRGKPTVRLLASLAKIMFWLIISIGWLHLLTKHLINKVR